MKDLCVGVLPISPISKYLQAGRRAHNLIGGLTALHKNKYDCNVNDICYKQN